MMRAFILCGCLLLATACTRTFNTTLPDVTTAQPIALQVEMLDITIAEEATPDVSVLPIAASTLAADWLAAHLQPTNVTNNERFAALVDADTVITTGDNPKFDVYTTTVSITFRYYTPQRNIATMESDMLIRSIREIDRNAEPEEVDAFKAAILRHIAERLDETVPFQLQKYFPALLASPPAPVQTEPATQTSKPDTPAI